LAGALAAACAGQLAHAAPPSDPDEAAFRQVCGRCHDTELVADTPRSYEDWEDTVQTMIEQGAKGTDAQFVSVMRYLYKTLTTVNVNTSSAEDLAAVLHAPDSVAAAIVARRAVRKFADLTELKSFPGLDPVLLDAKAKLIFF
jgi:DNA uptake protein ComE-like DNA-binding protein